MNMVTLCFSTTKGIAHEMFKFILSWWVVEMINKSLLLQLAGYKLTYIMLSFMLLSCVFVVVGHHISPHCSNMYTSNSVARAGIPEPTCTTSSKDSRYSSYLTASEQLKWMYPDSTHNMNLVRRLHVQNVFEKSWHIFLISLTTFLMAVSY